MQFVGKKNYRQMCGKLEKIPECLQTKLHPSDFMNTVFYVVF